MTDKIPVWPFIPEYEMTEELEWLTDVIKCPKGEDRICLRGEPRQGVQYSAFLEDVDAAEAKQISRGILRDVMIPYWPLSFVMPEARIEGVYDTPWIGPEHKSDGVFLWNSSRDYRSYGPLNSGVLLEGEVLGYGDSYGNFYGGIEGPVVWALKYPDTSDPFVIEGSTFIVQSLAVLQQPVDFNHKGGNVWEINFRATSTTPKLKKYETNYQQYEGVDILDSLNMSGGSLIEQHFIEVDLIQSDSGVMHNESIYDRPETLSSISFHATTPEEVVELKSWILSRHGMLVPFWVRSSNKDFLPLTNFVAAPNNASSITIRSVANLEAPFKLSVIHESGQEKFLTCMAVHKHTDDTQTLVVRERSAIGWGALNIIDMRILLLARHDSDRVELKYISGGQVLAQMPTRELYYNFN